MDNCYGVSYFHSTYDWWRDIVIPLVGAAVIPLLILSFTYLFGASRSEKRKGLESNISSINYLESFFHYIVVNLLPLYEMFYQKNEVCLNYQNTPINDRISLFSSTTFPNIYTDIDVEKYANFTLIKPSFTLDLLQFKKSLSDVFMVVENLNEDADKLNNEDKINSYLISYQHNLPMLLFKIAVVMETSLVNIANLNEVRQKLKLPAEKIVIVNFKEDEMRKIQEVLLFKQKYLDKLKNS